MSVKDVVNISKQAAKQTTKAGRSKEIHGVKMPGLNPAMVSMSLFTAKVYDEIMVKQLTTALAKKLDEFANVPAKTD